MPKYMIHPVKDRITQGFKANPAWYRRFVGQHGHNGIDYGSPYNTPVRATANGFVAFEGWGQNHSWMGKPAGICVILKHSRGYSGYAHLSRTVIDKGQNVKRGQIIGYVGSTGMATGPHLHFETFPLNPNFNNGFAGRVDPAVFKLGVPDPKPKPKRKPVSVYTVKRGDSLSAIATKHKTTWQKLAKINKLKNPNLIKVGQKIKLK